MSARSLSQLAVIAAACTAGALSAPEPEGRERSAAAPAREVGAPSSLAPRDGVAARQAPRRRWSRSRPVGVGAASFTPAVVVQRELPKVELPPDTERDEEWASGIERSMSRALTAALEVFPDVDVAEVRCLSWTCEVEVDVPGDIYDRVTLFVGLTSPLGPSVKPRFQAGNADVMKLRYTVKLEGFDGAGQWQEWYDRLREARRAEIERIVRAEQEGRPWDR